MVGCEEGLLPRWHTRPHDSDDERRWTAELAEERRRLYVGMTRARRRLVLCWAERRGGAERRPSRLLEEIGAVVFEVVRAGSPRQLSLL